MVRMNRREYIATGSTAFGTILAGCSSGENNDNSNEGDYTVSAGWLSPSSSNGSLALAFTDALHNNSNLVQLSTSEYGGHTASLNAYSNGEIELLTSDLYAMSLGKQGKEPFSESIDLPSTAFISSAVHYYVVGVEGSGIETTDDLAGKNVFAYPPGSSSRALFETLTENAGLREDITLVNVDPSDVAGAVDEGRIDAMLVVSVGGVALAGWLTQVDSIADVYVVTGTDGWINAIEETQGVVLANIEPYGWEQSVEADEVNSHVMPLKMVVDEGVANEAVYEMCRVSHEHASDIQESYGGYFDHSNAEQMVELADSNLTVFHPGAVEFYKEVGVWDEDSYTAGE